MQSSNIQYGLLGKTLVHSYSKHIHHLLGDYPYELYSVDQEEFEDILRARAFSGLNVTIPYKQEAMRYCDWVEPRAKRIGAVNTLVVDRDGRLCAYNTDYDGFEYLLQRKNMDFTGKKVLILGTGGTSRTVRTVAEETKAREIVLVSRSGRVDYQNVYEMHADAEYIVNTTPAGMYPNNGQRLLEVSRFKALKGVVDVIYNPRRTALVLDAQKNGIPCASGLPMLVAQARRAAELFTDSSIPEQAIERICNELYEQTTNLVLIGMPGSGKSTLGRLAAQRLAKTFVDVDEQIVSRMHMEIPEIFARLGEETFRNVESDVIRELSVRENLVIATGGGAVLRSDNADALRENGIVIHVQRPIALLEMQGRPLSQSREALVQMQEQRMPYYRACEDASVRNDGQIETVLTLVLEEYYAHIGD